MGFQFGNMNGFFGGGMVLIWILIIILFIFLLIFLFRQSSGSSNSASSTDTALEILKKRYAKGQITHQEFIEMKAHLEE